jgi:hypothetical protein
MLLIPIILGFEEALSLVPLQVLLRSLAEIINRGDVFFPLA